MTHHEQVSVLSCMHLQQVEEVKAQSQEIRQLSAVVEQQQKAIESLTSPQNPPRKPRVLPSHSETWLCYEGGGLLYNSRNCKHHERHCSVAQYYYGKCTHGEPKLL